MSDCCNANAIKMHYYPDESGVTLPDLDVCAQCLQPCTPIEVEDV